MMTKAKRLLLCCCLLAASCNGKADDDGGLDFDRMYDTCEAWCEIAVPCSEQFSKPTWGDFVTQVECEDACTTEVEHLTEGHEPCFDIMLDLRECAAVLTCQEFKEYENWAFAEPTTYPVACVEEEQAQNHNCNF